MPKISFNEIQKLVHEEYIKNGYEKLFNEHGVIGDIAELGLIHTEISETMEKIRTGEGWVEDELADIVIRVMNFCNRKKIRLQPAVLWKNEQNLKRPKLHGKVV